MLTDLAPIVFPLIGNEFILIQTFWNVYYSKMITNFDLDTRQHSTNFKNIFLYIIIYSKKLGSHLKNRSLYWHMILLLE